jgi:hypothetical protein
LMMWRIHQGLCGMLRTNWLLIKVHVSNILFGGQYTKKLQFLLGIELCLQRGLEIVFWSF